MSLTQCSDWFVSPGDDPECFLIMWEKIESRRVTRSNDGDRWTLNFIVIGSMDECWIRQRIESEQYGIPQQFRGVSLADYEVINEGWMVWRVEAAYGYVPLAGSRVRNKIGFARLPQQPSSYEFSTIGGSEVLTSAIVNEYQTPGAPDVRLAVNWDGTKVQGFKTTTAQQKWSETWKFSVAEVYKPSGYIDPRLAEEIVTEDIWELNALSLHDRWDAMSGAVHGLDSFYQGLSSTVWPKPDQNTRGPLEPSGYRQFNEGEIRFNGATARRLDDNHMQVTFEFDVVRNRWFDVPETVAFPGIEPDDYPYRRLNPTDPSKWQIWKYGWDLAQVHFAKKDKPANSEQPADGDIVIDEAEWLTVQQVIRRIPFHYLGVPGSAILRGGYTGEPPACVPHDPNNPQDHHIFEEEWLEECHGT